MVEISLGSMAYPRIVLGITFVWTSCPATEYCPGFAQVMENLESHGICEFHFYRPGKSWNSIVGHGKSWKIKVLFDRLVTADDKARTM